MTRVGWGGGGIRMDWVTLNLNVLISIRQMDNDPSPTGLLDYVCSVAPLWLALCDAMNCCPPDCSLHGILQARILEWVAISFLLD